MKYSVSEITDLIRYRRTIYPKDYSDREVHREMIERVLTNGTWAPNHGMTQPWRFTVFTGKARERLSVFLGEEYTRITPAEKFLQKKFDQLTQTFRSAAEAAEVKLATATDASRRVFFIPVPPMESPAL